jgi:hypothetical protein
LAIDIKFTCKVELKQALTKSSLSANEAFFVTSLVKLTLPMDDGSRVEMTEDYDCNNIVGKWLVIASAFSSIVKACRNEGNEQMLRHGIDDILLISGDVAMGINVM